MAAERKFVDLESNPDLIALVHDARNRGAQVVLREHGTPVASIVPNLELEPLSDEAEARIARIRALAGSMKDAFPEDFVEEIYRSRHEGSRKPSEGK